MEQAFQAKMSKLQAQAFCLRALAVNPSIEFSPQ
jgi:hypothetical protein